MTDWNKETELLGSTNFWKPETGSHKVHFLDDGKETQYRDPHGRVTDQMNFKIRVDGEQKLWTMTRAKTVNSLFGQIALIGKYHIDLTGKDITLLVKFDQLNNKREYTVEEALPLIDEWNAQKKTGKSKNKNSGHNGASINDVFSRRIDTG